jgi:MATE family multidrug resistance protein
MYFVNRVILAGYSADAMYAAVVCGNFVSIASWFFVGVASASEIFVGQLNGDGQYDKLSVPVWQMVYMSLFTTIIFVPLAYFSEYINFLPEYAVEHGMIYQKTLLYFGFLPSLVAGLSAFFIGQGKAKTVTFVILSGNALNAVLAYTLVYSFDQGTYGTAVATVISEFLQVIALGFIFLSERNRRVFFTWKKRNFDKNMFINCFRVGLPISVGHFLTILAWYFVTMIAGYSSRTIGIAYGIGVSLFVLVSFCTEGFSKAIIAIASNLIGSQDFTAVKTVYKRFTIMILIFLAPVMALLLLFHDFVTSFFGLDHGNVPGLQKEIPIVLCSSTFLLPLDALLFVTWGILSAGGDTKYPIVINQICLWGVMLGPIAILYYTNSISSVLFLYLPMFVYEVLSLFFIYKRYKTQKWFRKIV